MRSIADSIIGKILSSYGKDGYFVISAWKSFICDIDTPENISLENEYKNFLDKINGKKEAKNYCDLFLSSRNQFEDKHLHTLIKKSGYLYSKIYGDYISVYDESPNVKPLYVVYNYFRDDKTGDPEKMRKFAICLAKKFKQETVFIKMPNNNEEYIDQEGDVVARRNNNRKRIGFSKRLEGCPSFFENKYYWPPCSLADRRIRYISGEIFI